MACILSVIFLFCGCSKEDGLLQRVLQFRQRLLGSNGCSFLARIRADYGETYFDFALICSCDQEGSLSFRVLEPETIADISGSFSASGGKLHFADSVLAFPTLADGEVTPVSAPWLLFQTLRSGYIDSVGMEDDLLRATIHDSYEENALQLDIWFDAADRPVQAQILWQGRNVLSIFVENFEFV